MASRGRPPGLPKTGGRVKGSLDKRKRQLISGEIAADILSAYRSLGGAAFLLEYAQAQPGAFIRDCLSRLMPPMPKDEEPQGNGPTISINGLSDVEAATRIAFALAKAQNALNEQQTVSTVERVPSHGPECLPPLDKVPVDPAGAEWANSLRQSNEEQLVQETHTASLETYSGSSAEQGLRRRNLLQKEGVEGPFDVPSKDH